MINNSWKKDIYKKNKFKYFSFVHRFLGSFCAVVGGCDGNGGRPAAGAVAVAVVVVVVGDGATGLGAVVVDFADIGAGDLICVCWNGIELERMDAGVICVHIVGWRTVVPVCGWKNGVNWVVVVVAAPVVGSNNGLSRDGPSVNCWSDCCRLKVEKSSISFSFICLSLSHRRRMDGTRRKIRKPVNVIIRTIQNAATIVFVKIKFSNICWLIIFEDTVVVFSSNLCSCFKSAVIILFVLVFVIVLTVDVVVGARNIGIMNVWCGR